ncbi:MerR family transcriptional regulator [Virgibacillus siamensis]|uniref:MerR family transcriptional regulator n=1 Tax=Virgibacillus siamensis TaxID=480071 RepID=A0ABN1FHA9_9BACI
MNSKTGWKVGELANQTGLTVRTLHHYDKIRLLTPSQRSGAGHRIYNEADIARLQQIMSLKQLGFPLEDIKQMIESPDFEPTKVVQLQLERLNDQIRIQEQLRSQLTIIYELLKTKQDVSVKHLINLIEVINMDNYFTQEQLNKMKSLGDQYGPEEKRKHEQEMSDIVSNIREEIRKGTAPDNPKAIELARRWKELTEKFTGGDENIVKAAEQFYKENPDTPVENYGVDEEVYRFIKNAMSHA